MYRLNFITKKNRLFIASNFLLSVLLLNGSAAIKIKKLQVPSVVEQGNSAVLNCAYTLDSDADEYGIVIKWYLKELDALYAYLVYQWIPLRKPQAFGKLKNRLNSHYYSYYGNESSTLHITNASFELSGEYTCKVSSFISEDTAQKNMLVFVPPSNVTIHKKIDGSKQLVICYVENIYPVPNVKIFIDDREVDISSLLLYGNRSTLYSIQATKILSDNDTIPKEMSCQIDTPEINYYNRIEASSYFNNTISSSENSRLLLLLLLLLLQVLMTMYSY